MSTKKDPAFLWYCTAWLQSERVRSMTLEQRGAYVDLLSFGWLHGSIPSCPKRLAAMLGLSSSQFVLVWSAVGECWSEMPGNPGRLINERQEHERAERKTRAEEMRQRGQAGGKQSVKQRAKQNPSRTQAGGQADGQAKAKPSTSTTISTELPAFLPSGSADVLPPEKEGRKEAIDLLVESLSSSGRGGSK